MFKKAEAKSFIEKYRGYIGTVAVLAVVYGIFQLNQITTIRSAVEPISSKIVKLVEQECTTKEAKIVLNDSVLFNNSNYVVLNLDNFELAEDIIRNGKRYIKYRQFGASDRYYTIATKIEKKLIKVKPEEFKKAD